MKVVIAESNNAKDFYDGRLDGKAAYEVLRVAGIDVKYRLTLDQANFRRSIKLAADIDADVFHMSCHGDDEGVQLTDGTDIDWADLSGLFQSFANDSKLLVYASCGGGHLNAAKAFTKRPRKFGYICGSGLKRVGFYESCIAWSVLYNIIAASEMNPETMQSAIDKINNVISGYFVYRRWEDRNRRYLRYPARETR